MVRTNTIAGPGSDAAVVRLKETDQSIAMSLDGNGRYCYLDPREGARLAVAECCRNLATTGAVPVAATNNLNFGNPERPEIMAQLVEAIDGIAEACEFFEAPITGGNVSLYNETLGEGIYPTPVLGIIGLMKTKVPAPVHFAREGADLLLLGGFGTCDERHFGGTQYAKAILGDLWGLPPRIDLDYEKRVHDAIRAMIEAGIVESAHDLSDGGLAVAVSESCTAKLGAKVTIPTEGDSLMTLFGEAPSRILVSVSNTAHVHEIARKFGVECQKVGAIMKERLQIGNERQMLIDLSTSDLVQAFETSLPRLLQAQHD
jgi:phosphoribosylformylglycinamidine synthase